LSDARDQLEGIEFVERIETRHVDRRKFQAEKSATDLQNAEGFPARPMRGTLRMPRDGHTVKLRSE
jgi:hypothetical protein